MGALTRCTGRNTRRVTHKKSSPGKAEEERKTMTHWTDQFSWRTWIHWTIHEFMMTTINFLWWWLISCSNITLFLKHNCKKSGRVQEICVVTASCSIMYELWYENSICRIRRDVATDERKVITFVVKFGQSFSFTMNL